MPLRLGRPPQRRLPRRPQRRPQRRNGSFGASPLGAVTFPTTTLVTRVLIALGADLSASPLTWQWEDITQWVRYDLGVALVTGRPDESSRVQYGRAQMKLDNRDGRFSRRNPTGPYYGLLSQNTPIWATVDAGSGVHTRLEMFVNEWPTRWADKTTNDSTVTIQCAGVLRRLAQGVVLKSALRRSLERNPVVLTYWPLEDGANATSAASGITGGTPMSVSGTPSFATSGPPDGSGLLLDLADGGTLTGRGRVPSTSPDAMRLQLLMRFGTGLSAGAAQTLMEWTTSGGTYTRWRLGIDAADELSVDFYSSSATENMTTIQGTFYDSAWHRIEIGQRPHQTTGDLITYLLVDGIAHATGPDISFGVGETFGYIDTLTINPTNASGSHMPAVGHVVVNTQDVFAEADPFSPDPGLDGYTGEMAHERMTRLCSEEGVPFLTLASTSPTLGPQGIDTLLSLLRDAEAVGGGVLYEKRWGLAYQSLAERYNAPVGMTLDFDLGQIGELPEPADDDQRLRNKWTVSRTDGSEYTAEETAAPMGTGAGGPGVYDDSATVNVETDNQLSSQAGWRLHLGTVDEDRWPAIDINLAASPELVDTWTALSYGARLNVLHPLDQVAPDTIDAIIEGYREHWNQFLWTASLNTSPFSPYRVNVVGSTEANIGRIDAANSTLAANATDVATSLSVASAATLWVTGAVSFDIGVSGEQMTVTNISGGSSPQTFTVTRSVNGVTKSLMSGAKVSLWRPGVIAL